MQKNCSQSLPVITIPAKLMAVQKTEAAPLIRGRWSGGGGTGGLFAIVGGGKIAQWAENIYLYI